MRIKKIAAALMGLIVVVGLSGCGNRLNEKLEKQKDSKTAKENVVTNHYEVNSLDINMSGFSDNESICEDSIRYCDGKIYFGTKISGDISQASNYIIYCYAIKDKSLEKLFSFKKKPGKNILPGNICYLDVTDSGDILLMYYSMTYDVKKDANYKHIDKYIYGKKGKVKQKISFEDDTAISYGMRCSIDKNDNTYIATENEETCNTFLLRYNKEGKITGKVELEYMSPLNIDGQNRIIAKFSGVSGSSYAYIDVDNNSKDSNSLKEINDSDEIYSILGCYGEDIYFAGAMYIYSYNTKTGKLEGKVNCQEVNINSSNIIRFVKIDESSFLCVNYNDINDSGELEFLILSQTESNDDNRTVLTLATIYENDSNLKNIINKYNKSNDKYRVEYRSYGLDSDDPVTEMNKDIMTGNGPDIYLIDDMDVNNMLNKGMLENLSPYIEKDDVLGKEYFTEGYLDAIAVDGNQYFLQKTFYLDTLYGYGKELNEYKDKWNIESFNKYYSSKPEGAVLFNDMSEKGTFYRIAEGCINEYIDWNNGECRFDDASFEQLLELCSASDKIPEYDNEKPAAYKLRDRELLFGNNRIGCPYDIKNIDEIFGGDALYIGYPWNNGGVSLKTDGSTFAIASDSDNKNAAWDIIKELLTGEYDKYSHRYGRGECIPTSAKEYDMLLKDSVINEDYVAEDGQTVRYALEPSDCNTMLEPPSDKEIAVLKELISRAHYQANRNFECEVIKDDVDRYLEGEKKLQDTVNIIQDKMTKYVNENLTE